MKIVLLSGGVGGAKLADGLARRLSPADLTVVVNTGDDFDHLGLRICPDLDTVLYTLAGLAHPEHGWGRADETWAFLGILGALGGPTWFHLGDRDLALHVERTRRLGEGQSLSEVTRHLARALGVQAEILPMSNEATPTIVITDEGTLSFQEYFVARRWHPHVRGFRFEGMEQARPAPGILEAIHAADAIVLGPSNPWVSLDPILSVPGIRDAIAGQRVIAVSPIIAGSAVKGPAAKMFSELGITPSAPAVADHFRGLVTDFVLDYADEILRGEIESQGTTPWLAKTVMSTRDDREKLAGEILEILAKPVPQRRPA